MASGDVVYETGAMDVDRLTPGPVAADYNGGNSQSQSWWAALRASSGANIAQLHTTSNSSSPLDPAKQYKLRIVEI